MIDNKDSKKRYRADVLIEDQLAKYDDKMNKEVAKAAKKFGDAFDEAQFRSTNGRVLEHQAKRDALHARFAKALNDGDLDELLEPVADAVDGPRLVLGAIDVLQPRDKRQEPGPQGQPDMHQNHDAQTHLRIGQP